MIKPEDFETQVSGAVYLSKEGKKKSSPHGRSVSAQA